MINFLIIMNFCHDLSHNYGIILTVIIFFFFTIDISCHDLEYLKVDSNMINYRIIMTYVIITSFFTIISVVTFVIFLSMNLISKL